ncbi:MAG TPA: MmgE/PrpD family protein [Burkholderiales bacterium]|nr:MmgE/PrpD family protein [Burkholderiales bacterium]
MSNELICDATTRRLADFAMAARYEALPTSAVHACKLRLIDTFASALGAYDEPLSDMARKVAGRNRGDAQARVWGSAIRTTPEAAAFANGVMTRLLDISDTYTGASRGHPSDMNSGVIAVAEAVKADGKSLINALVLAYDVYCSFADAIDWNERGWDQPIYSILGCVTGIGTLLKLTPAQMTNAIALALAPNMALVQSRRGHLSSWKGCAGANASRNAVFAAELAKDGFTGPTALFDGDGGVFQVLGTRFEWNPPKARHLIEDTHIKGLPVCYHGQSAVWAAIELHENVDASRIESVEVDTYKTGVVMMGGDPSRWAPKTRETADHSLPYCVSVALLDGKVVNESFADARLHDPAIANLMRKVKVREDEALTRAYPNASPGRVTVRTTSGETHVKELEYPRGHAKSPMRDTDVETKFFDLARPRLGEAQCESLLEAVRNLERSADVARDLIGPLVKE